MAVMVPELLETSGQHPEVVGTPAPDSNSLLQLASHLTATIPDVNVREASPWISISAGHSPLPSQGWKLHVSGNPTNAIAILNQVVPVLASAGVSFKFTRSLADLNMLNQGESGFSQIGKFMTIYPRNDDEAVSLASQLDVLTRNFTGPAIPSDRQLAPGSNVFYRYGSFDGRYMQTPLGQILPAIQNPQGELEPDRRTTSYQQPGWITDPFEQAGLYVQPEPIPSTLIGGRFLPVTMLHGSPRGAVHLAFDTVALQPCVLKQARQGGAIDRNGDDSRSHLRHEYAILQSLADDGRFPRVYGLHEFQEDLFLAMEDIAGHTLGGHVSAQLNAGSLPDGRQVVEQGLELVSLVHALHQRNIVFRDLKSTNVIVARDNRLRLIDFELAVSLDDPDHGRAGAGTPGYMSRQQLRGDAPAITDDIYAIGALLYQMATGAEPGQAADRTNLLARPVKIMNPTIGDSLVSVIETCLAAEPENRYQSTTDLEAALVAARPGASRPHPGFGSPLPAHDEQQARLASRNDAERLARSFLNTYESGPGTTGIFWRSTHPQTNGFLARDLNTGTSGTVLALAELANEFRTKELRDALASGARWLLHAPAPGGTPLPGLYVGEGAVAAALLRAGQVLDDDDLIAEAAERATHIARTPHVSPDLFNGTAGRIRLHLWMYEATSDSQHLAFAIAGGEHLLREAVSRDNDEITWTMPEGYASLSGPLGLGYAHGVSGVADVLLDLYEVTSDSRFQVVARRAARWLARQARPTLDDHSGAAWPDTEGGEPITGFWCHGAPGIGQFLLHAAEANLIPEARDLAIRAAKTAGQSVRHSSPTQCHGLAGNIEFLLDVYQSTGDARFLREARALEVLMHTFAREQQGNLVYASDFQNVYSSDYMVGYAGVAVTLLRLAAPERLPRQLSRAGFHSSRRH